MKIEYRRRIVHESVHLMNFFPLSNNVNFRRYIHCEDRMTIYRKSETEIEKKVQKSRKKNVEKIYTNYMFTN